VRVVPKMIRQMMVNADLRQWKGTFDLPDVYLGAVAAMVALVEQLPPELTPPDSDKYLSLSAGLAGTKAALDQYYVRRGNAARFCEMSKFDKRNPLEMIYDALEGLPDSVPAPETKGFEFIEDGALRDNLRLDLSDATSALGNNEWKAATVLSASVIEALLLWELKQHPPNDDSTLKSISSKPLEEWDLYHYLQGANKLGCLLSDTIKEAEQAKEYRNLIHPGRTERLKMTCDLGTAHVAIGAADHVARDLANRVCPRPAVRRAG